MSKRELRAIEGPVQDPKATHEPWLRYADAARLPEGDTVDVRSLLDARLARLEIEVGPGRGGFLIDRLVGRPDVTMVALRSRRNGPPS